MNFEKRPDYYGNTRADLIALLPSIRGRFLEVGCGEGATLEYVRSKGADYVAGIDSNSAAIAAANRKGLDRAIVADIEKDELPFGEKEFDCIVLADVLEHLYDPWSVLRKLRSRLKDDGRMLLSIPNVKHYSVLGPLVFRDEWSYSDIGILDSSHLRFFTLREIKKLLAGAGLTPRDIRPVVNAGMKFRLLNALLFNRLQTFSVVQYYILAEK